MPNEFSKEKYLTDSQVKELERVLNKFKDRDIRNCTMLWVLLYTGGRAQEVLNLTVKDFCPIEETITIHGLKKSNNREIPIPKWLAKRVSELQPSEDGRLFPIAYTRLRDIWVLYRPVPKKLHSLRHTAAIRILRKTKDMAIVKAVLGHRSWSNTFIYADYLHTQDELRKALLGGTSW